jgi:hypothetical protein
MPITDQFFGWPYPGNGKGCSAGDAPVSAAFSSLSEAISLTNSDVAKRQIDGSKGRKARISFNSSTSCSPIIATLIIALPGIVLRNRKAAPIVPEAAFFLFFIRGARD